MHIFWCWCAKSYFSYEICIDLRIFVYFSFVLALLIFSLRWPILCLCIFNVLLKVSCVFFDPLCTFMWILCFFKSILFCNYPMFFVWAASILITLLVFFSCIFLFYIFCVVIGFPDCFLWVVCVFLYAYFMLLSPFCMCLSVCVYFFGVCPVFKKPALCCFSLTLLMYLI